MMPFRKGLALGLRGLLLGSLVVALMGPQAVQRNRGLTTIFVVDRSDSVADADQRRQITLINEAIGAMREEDKVGVVAFGKAPVMEASPGGRRTISSIDSAIDGAASDLAAGLRLAMASFPAGTGRRIVVLSDGNETKGDALGAMESIVAEGVEVDVVPLGIKQDRPEASVLDLQAPSEEAADQPFELRAVVDSSVAQSGRLVIERNGEPVSQTPVSLPAGTSTVVVNQSLKDPGFYRYRAYLEVGQDTDNRNNLGAAFVAVKGRPRVLLIQGNTDKRELATALSEQGITVQLGGASMMPSRPEDLQTYDALILNDFNASLTTELQMKMVRNAVRDSGIGLMMIGGENGFLPGGWFGTPIAEALPVDLNVRQRKVFPNTSVMVVVDTSGSMSMSVGGVTKLQLAAKAAALTTELLTAKDRLGVAGSGNHVDYVSPLAELTNKDQVVNQIRRLKDGGGGIYAEPSVRFAQDKLSQEDSRVRHFILVADGSDCDTHGTSFAIAAAMRSSKITVSTVAIGEGKDVEFLRGLAAIGGGRHYLVKDAAKLPQIFTQDVSLMSRSAIEEGAFIPKVMPGEEATRGITTFPALMAYCLTEGRPLARVSMRTHKDDPLYATWQYGLGKSAAFTSDAQNRWAKEWIGWDGFGRFWAQSVRSLTRKAALNNYDLQVVPEGGRGRVELQARDRAGNPLTLNSIDVRISDPEGNSQKATLTQSAPGTFSGAFDASAVGSYIVSVVEPAAQGEARVSSNGFSIPYPPEYRTSRTNRPLLEGLSSPSGGKVLEKGADAMRPLAVTGESVTDIWRLFLTLALVLLPLDVLVRRVVVPLPAFGRVKKAESADESVRRSAPGRSAPLAGAATKVAKKGSPPRSGTVEPVDSAPVAPISAGGSLLEAKRRRQNQESEK
jgi:uncharacterized membrane protein